MTIHIIKKSDAPDAEIAISGMYNGTVWLSYGEQVELVSWLMHNRSDIVTMIQNRRTQK